MESARAREGVGESQATRFLLLAVQVREEPRTTEAAEQDYTAVIRFGSQMAANTRLQVQFAPRCCCPITLEPRSPCSVWQTAAPRLLHLPRLRPRHQRAHAGGPDSTGSRVSDLPLELVITGLAVLACPRASPSPPLRSYERSAAQDRIDTEHDDCQAEEDQRLLDRHRN